MMEELHNNIIAIIASYISRDKISTSDVVLILEMVKQDLVSQVISQKYIEEKKK